MRIPNALSKDCGAYVWYVYGPRLLKSMPSFGTPTSTCLTHLLLRHLEWPMLHLLKRMRMRKMNRSVQRFRSAENTGNIREQCGCRLYFVFRMCLYMNLYEYIYCIYICMYVYITRCILYMSMQICRHMRFHLPKWLKSWVVVREDDYIKRLFALNGLMNLELLVCALGLDGAMMTFSMVFCGFWDFCCYGCKML